MKESLIRLDSTLEATETYKEFGSDTCNDSDAHEQKECTPNTELGFLFLFLLILGVLAAMSIARRRIASFNIWSRRS